MFKWTFYANIASLAGGYVQESQENFYKNMFIILQA